MANSWGGSGDKIDEAIEGDIDAADRESDTRQQFKRQTYKLAKCNGAEVVLGDFEDRQLQDTWGVREIRGSLP